MALLGAHWRKAILVALVAVMAAACTPALGKPALRQVSNAPRVWNNADPSVLVYGGKTYLFGTTNNMRVPVRLVTTYATTLADSKAQWAATPRDAMPTRPAWVDPAEYQIWAPSVARIGTKFIMYFTGRHRGATTDEVNDQCIGRSIATQPMGPYVPETSPVYCGYPRQGPVAHAGLPASNYFGRGALDPSVFRAPDGKLYLLMALSRTLDNIGVVQLRSNGSVIGGVNATPKILARQSMPWHDGIDDGVRNGGFLENPTMLYDSHTKTYLLFFSAGRYRTAYYNTSFVRCGSPMGECVQDTRGPFLKTGNGRSGVGGLTAYIGASGQPRVAYATWQAGYEGVGSNPRHTHWAVLNLTATSDPAKQSVSLG